MDKEIRFDALKRMAVFKMMMLDFAAGLRELSSPICTIKEKCDYTIAVS
ncbi:hypothetical protein PPEP_a4588 [Pseudoalteromonas peptidolytica F12-50-A1]|uniref:Uncharacterized protein n=1 Tax=Pseudoalteromonas peptidolytica F12-50-A1 TaxID=1315280 RepID=A0A8I0MZS0_9GAMM|nr:hypothetical protein [Pseudoalteromonas peptidolytica F12-50-A1]